MNLTQWGETMNAIRGTVQPGRLGEETGWNFAVYYDGRSYPNFISSLVKTEIGAKRNLAKYLKTGRFSWYGNAE